MNSKWRLPSKDELNAMYHQLHLKGLGGFESTYYWSSSEVGGYYAWSQFFGSGFQHDSHRDSYLLVRLVRELEESGTFPEGQIFSCNGQAFEVAERDEPEAMTLDEAMAIGDEDSPSDLIFDLLRRAHVAAGGTAEGHGSSWHDLPERIEALIADRDMWKVKAERYKRALLKVIGHTGMPLIPTKYLLLKLVGSIDRIALAALKEVGK